MLFFVLMINTKSVKNHSGQYTKVILVQCTESYSHEYAEGSVGTAETWTIIQDEKQVSSLGG